MKKYIVVIITAVMLILMLCGWKFKSGGSRIKFWTDTETGVEYVIYSGLYQGGICPRYDVDGTLMIDGKE